MAVQCLIVRDISLDYPGICTLALLQLWSGIVSLGLVEEISTSAGHALDWSRLYPAVPNCASLVCRLGLDSGDHAGKSKLESFCLIVTLDLYFISDNRPPNGFLESSDMAKFADIYDTINLPPCGFFQAKELEEVLGDWCLEEKMSVALIITDQTRPLKPSIALKALQRRINGDISVIIGLGLHREMTAQELVGLEEFSPIQHNPDELSSIRLASGETVSLSSSVLEAEVSISIGVAELHQYAGVSGGYKGITVGCGSRKLIGALHSREMVCHSSVQLGRVEGNIFRERIDEIGRHSNCALALNFIPSTGDWLFGIPDRVTRQARKRIHPWMPVSRVYEGVRLHVPSSKAGSFYQASRAATYLALSPNPPLKTGGTIELVAGCEEGLGEEWGFVQALREAVPPWSSVLEGEEPRGAGAQRIVMLARMARRFQLRIVGCKACDSFQEIGIDTQPDIPPLSEGWLEIHQPFQQIPQLEGQ